MYFITHLFKTHFKMYLLIDLFFRTHHHVTFLDNAVAILNRGNALTIRY